MVVSYITYVYVGSMYFWSRGEQKKREYRAHENSPDQYQPVIYVLQVYKIQMTKGVTYYHVGITTPTTI